MKFDANHASDLVNAKLITDASMTRVRGSFIQTFWGSEYLVDDQFLDISFGTIMTFVTLWQINSVPLSHFHFDFNMNIKLM